ncbi:DUF4267 domain-containing protein [Kutzneria kofuensis]|uniref:Small membrane hydrophobic protein n=1 Tax=Kutzneria kofuensis TaxID=103725 RepID=A0A7W9NJZ9_9PSEU|nr:DUF4267 domain-containing protein [Kutzneria kofuensis]MBB5894698.1 hypothetical protein [Kutzneria kofuensis]
MYTATVILAVVLGVAVVVMGAFFLIAPTATAKGFGLPEWPDGVLAAWLNVKGIRDLATGLATLVMLAASGPHAMGWFMLVAAVIPVGDAIIVLRWGGSKVLAWAMHGGTAAVVIALAVALLAG